jgi:hypothetical protein
MTPAQHAFLSHVKSAPFQVGATRNMWGYLDEDPDSPVWPAAYCWVAAAAKAGFPDRFSLRFDLTGYPEQAPTAMFWDMDKNGKLSAALWPKGTGHLPVVFNPGNNFLYAPCDRGANPAGHGDWPVLHPQYYWQSTFTIVTYLNFVYENLHAPEYL